MERYKKIRSSWPPTIGVISGCADWTCLVIEHYYHQRAEAGGGTSCLAGEVVGRETILNYPTAAVQVLLWDRRRTTLWMSPDLGCFALRIRIEVRRPDGSFHLVNEKEALKVTLNH
jgi:hypothetical protein